MTDGFIKLHRKMLQWEWFDNSNIVSVFLFCLLKANHRSEKWHGVEIEKGQFITSYEKVAHSTGLTIQNVRTALNKLKSTHELTYQTTRQYTIITIKNWNSYQAINTRTNKQLTNNQQTTNKQLTINKNDKNDKNDKNTFISQGDKKTDPYFSPLKIKFEEEYKKVFSKKPYLQRQECFKIIELAQDFDNFLFLLPEAFRKLKSLCFEDIRFKPTASWLLKDSNFSKLMNGEFDEKGEEDKDFISQAVAKILESEEKC